MVFFTQMEGVRVFSPDDWEASGLDSTSFAADDLKKCLEGLAKHLFGKVVKLLEQMLLYEMHSLFQLGTVMSPLWRSC